MCVIVCAVPLDFTIYANSTDILRFCHHLKTKLLHTSNRGLFMLLLLLSVLIVWCCRLRQWFSISATRLAYKLFRFVYAISLLAIRHLGYPALMKYAHCCYLASALVDGADFFTLFSSVPTFFIVDGWPRMSVFADETATGGLPQFWRIPVLPHLLARNYQMGTERETKSKWDLLWIMVWSSSSCNDLCEFFFYESPKDHMCTCVNTFVRLFSQ